MELLNSKSILDCTEQEKRTTQSRMFYNYRKSS